MITEEKWVPTICWGCIEGYCAIKVRVVDGVVVNIEGNCDGPGFDTLVKNQGKVCPKAFGQVQKLYNPHRIRRPMKRTNPEKGPGVDARWVEISWDEALKTVAERLKAIRPANTMRLLRGYGGPQTSSLLGTWDAFFQAYGPTQQVQGGSSIRCDMAEHILANITHGGFHCEPDVTYCNYLLLLSENPSSSGGAPANLQFVNARARGMKTVVVSPVFSPTAAKADEWIPIRPGTDAAFLLAMIEVIINELGQFDRDFLKHMTDSPYLVASDGHFVRDRGTNKPLCWDASDQRAKPFDEVPSANCGLEGTYMVQGSEAKPAFQKLKEHVAQYTPEWAGGITDIPAATIRRIAGEWLTNARIGSTIELEGAELPYRPVATKMGRAITGSMHGGQTVMANHILAAIVGAIEVPGGHCGGRWQPAGYNHGITPGPDGVPHVDAAPFSWPPVSYDRHEALFPYSNIHGIYSHLTFLNIARSPNGFDLAPPEAYLRYRANPLVSIGQTEIVMEALKKIPFIVSLAYVSDEMTDFSDVVLPEHTELERFELVPFIRRGSTAKRFSGVMLRQPVVSPVHDTMDIADIFTELASRMGFLEDYNGAINRTLALTDPYKLDRATKYAWPDIVNRQCLSVTKGAHDLEWFKTNAGTARSVPAREQYDVHLGMKSSGLRYQLPYLEQVKKTGENLANNLSRVGVDWWSTAEYTALPTYVDPVFEQSPKDYDFYVTTSKSMQFSWGNNVDIPWLIELGQMDSLGSILMNAVTGVSRGLRDGDEVWVESPAGKVRGKVKLVQGIRPDTVAILGQFGQWTMPLARDTGRASQTPLLPISYEWTDSLLGCMQGQVVKAKVYK